MAKKSPQPDAGAWLLLEDQLERGDPAFVDGLRGFHDPDRLATFALSWYADKRAASRKLLLDYLQHPLNAFRHEPLVKRMFKLAEKANDDEAMAHFLALFDRSVRRKKAKRHHYDTRSRKTWEEEWVRVPKDGTMPRKRQDYYDRKSFRVVRVKKNSPLTDHEKEEFAKRRLFTVHTRNYLRRRAWRYFRNLGKQHPDRYVNAVAQALRLYRDDDAPDGLALLDNWGLIHALFHNCPALVARPHGWQLADGHSLAELAPAPAFLDLWKKASPQLYNLLKEVRCRPVRQWVLKLLRRDHGAFLGTLPLTELLGLLTHEDSDVVALGAEGLRTAPGLEKITLERWLELLETPNPTALEVLCELMVKHVHADKLTLEQTVKLAVSRPLPVARLGLTLLQGKKITKEEECRRLLGLVEAEAEPLRAELVRWARGVLSASKHFQAEWVLEYLDSRHQDVRGEGWAWYQNEPRARDNVTVWRKLLESPYDDVRLALIADLEARVKKKDPSLAEQGQLDPELLRLLWATVLLNIHRGNRSKPVVVRQIVQRLTRKPAEAPQLLPILGVALRSVRGPEFRSGLAGVMQLVERTPDMEPVVRKTFPELQWA